MNSIKTLYEEHVALWHLARDEMQGMPLDAPEWGLLYHDGDKLAGWCTQIAANNRIRSNELQQLKAFPALDEAGPYAAWIQEIKTSKPRVFDYVRKLEEMRLALLQAIDAT